MIDQAQDVAKPTLMRQFEDDEDLDNWTIQHAYMFTVIQVRPGGFVNGYGSNYVREEIKVADHESTDAALAVALKRAEALYGENKKRILIYAVADFAGAIGFNRPVRQWPPNTYRSKADKRRDEEKAKAARRAERDLARELKRKDPKKIKEPTAAIFKTDFPYKKAVIDTDSFMSDPRPMIKVSKG